MKNVIDIQKFKKNKFFQINYEGIAFRELLHSSLQYFYSIPFDEGIRAPLEWNPILIFGDMGIFDSYMMTGSQSRQYTGNNNHVWKPWPSVNGIERTKLFLEDISSLISSSTKYKVNYKPSKILQAFMYTKEKLSENEIILSILFLYDRSIKRIYIKNLKKTCMSLTNFSNVFPRVLGYSKEKFKMSNMFIKKERYHELFEFIEDGSNISIQDESVYEIYKKFGFLETQIFSIS